MEEVKIKKIYKPDEKIINQLSSWLYNWWGKDENYTLEQMNSFVKYSMQKDKLPQTYVMTIHDKIIGMFQFIYDDLSVRPDIYPWLANVYIDEKYRGKGYGRKLLEYSIQAIKKIDHSQIFLYTPHDNLYEKFGWEFVSYIDTYNKTPRMQKLYKYVIK